MSLKILKQQLKDIAIEETPEEPQKEKKRAKEALPEKFTRARKVMKKNTKPKQKPESLESNVNRIKDDVQYARERKEQNMKWNMDIINAVSTVDGTDIMNRYLQKKGLVSDTKSKKSSKNTSAASYRAKPKARKPAKPATFMWESSL
ncbi:hypothetical protein WA556_004875 [Blastocystis sp. ATCC 50177/Nand II]